MRATEIKFDNAIIDMNQTTECDRFIILDKTLYGAQVGSNVFSIIIAFEDKSTWGEPQEWIIKYLEAREKYTK